MHIQRKIILSTTEPERNSLWLNPETETLKFFHDGWKVLGGGSGGSDEALKQAVTALQKGKQDVLMSGSTIKTVNGQSLLGSGDIEIVTEVDEETVKKLVDDILQDNYLTNPDIDEACGDTNDTEITEKA